MALTQLEPEAVEVIQESIRERWTLQDWLRSMNAHPGMTPSLTSERMAILAEHLPRPRSRRRQEGRVLTFPSMQAPTTG